MTSFRSISFLIFVVATAGCGSDDQASSKATGGAAGTTSAGSGGMVATGGTTGGGGTAGGGSPSTGATGGGGTPSEGGIASKYPGDVGIENDASVLFADDFETYSAVSDLTPKWTDINYADRMRIATEPENVFHGGKAVEFKLPPSDTVEVGVGIKKILAEEHDLFFLRYYLKYAPNFIRTNHNGSTISAHYFIDGTQATPGIPADGTNKFLAALETERGPDDPAPGRLNVYVYHPEQRSQWGDHFFPDGFVMPYSPDPFDFGSDFVSRPNFVPELDRWYCYEYMVKANTPGVRDGRITVWVDGVVAADFGNLRLRDIDDLKVDLFILGMSSITSDGEQTKWHDSLVAATSYIGPLVE